MRELRSAHAFACAMAAVSSIASADVPPVVATGGAVIPAEDTLILPNGTKVLLMVLTEVSSQRSRPGDPVKLRVAEAVRIHDLIAIPAGTPVFGTVTSSEKSGAALQRGRIGVELSHVQLASERIKLTGTFDRIGKGGKNDDLVKALLVPAYALFAPGNSGKFKAGEMLTAMVSGDHQIHLVTEPLYSPGNGGNSSGPLSGSSTSGMAGTTSGGSR